MSATFTSMIERAAYAAAILDQLHDEKHFCRIELNGHWNVVEVNSFCAEGYVRIAEHLGKPTEPTDWYGDVSHPQADISYTDDHDVTWSAIVTRAQWDAYVTAQKEAA